MLDRILSRRATPKVPAPLSIRPTQQFDGNDGPWSSFPVEIGTPPQTVRALISTASSQTWAVDPQGCQPSDAANCSVSRGGFFQSNDSSTWSPNNEVNNGLYPLVLEEHLNVTGNSTVGSYGYDTVALPGQGRGMLELDHQVVADIATKDYYLGLFGLSPKPVALPDTSTEIPSFLSNLNQSRLIPSLSWSYTAGNQYRPGPAYGSLILGGYDTSRYMPNDISYTFNETGPTDLMVNIGGITLYSDALIDTVDTDNESILVAIDSTTPYMILPSNVCAEFEYTFNITWDENVQAYLVNDTLHDALVSQHASVTLNIGNSSTIPGQGVNITLPYAAFDLNAEAPLLNTPGRYFPLRRAANESQYTLGRTFLQEAYVIANYENNNFSVSQCAWNSSAEPYIVAIHPPGYKPPQSSGGLSGGAIAGIVVGVIMAVIIAILVGFVFWKRRRSSKAKEPKQVNTEVAEMDAEGKGQYLAPPTDMHKNHPQSPELDGAVHKGHELPGSPYSEHAPEQRFELDATERQRASRVLSSPISLLSEMSDAMRLHQRQTSDPISPTLHSRQPSNPASPIVHSRQPSDTASPTLHSRQPSNPASPIVHSRQPSDTASPILHSRQPSDTATVTRARSDATKLHKRELSDPVSILSERRDEGGGTSQ